MLELVKMLVLIAAGVTAIKLLTRTMTPNRSQKQEPQDESDET